MKKLKFTKMHGCGNDYIYVNCFEQTVSDPARLSVKMSDRRYGVGADGLILICPPSDATANAAMRMFNADGSEGKMCGNGIRCVGKFLRDKGISYDNNLKIQTPAGVKNLNFIEYGEIKAVLRVDMGKPSFNTADIPVYTDKNFIIEESFYIDGVQYIITCVSVGNPHCVVFCRSVDDIDIENIGPSFGKSTMFPEGVNTEFIEILDEKTIKMRVWERGSGETLACGTGACASVAAAVAGGYCKAKSDVTVRLKGGNLIINCHEDGVFMTGDAQTVFEGEAYI